MESQGSDGCLAFSKLNPKRLPLETSCTVSRIMEDTTRQSERYSSVTSVDVSLTPSISTFSHVPTWNNARVPVPQLPAWIYGTRFSRQGLPRGYNIRPSQRQPREKRARQIFSSEQVKRLETEFDQDRYVTAVKRLELASTLGLTETQIKTWFQNRRTKWRKEIRAEITGDKPVELVTANFQTFPAIMSSGAPCSSTSLSGHFDHLTARPFSFPIVITDNSDQPQFFLNTGFCK